MPNFHVLSVGQDAKTIKNLKLGYLTGILYLAPHKLSGVNLCPKASLGCIKSCLFSAGMGRFDNVIKARMDRTKLFIENKNRFLDLLKADIHVLAQDAKNRGLKPSVRLNGTSDYCWEKHDIFDYFPEIQFMDYTKIIQRMNPASKAQSFKNYHLTFSRSESNLKEVKQSILWRKNVAVVFNEIPLSFMGRKVIDGDESDCRWLDKKGVIVGLKAKGNAKKDDSNFVVTE